MKENQDFMDDEKLKKFLCMSNMILFFDERRNFWKRKIANTD